MKKYLLIAIALIFVLAACNRKSFVKKLVGTWKLDKYLVSGLEQTTAFDTTFREYQLMLGEDEIFSEAWKNYAFFNDSDITFDTIITTDTVLMVNDTVITSDTFRYVDTVITPYLRMGKWDLINSEEDLQLRDDSTSEVRIYRILELSAKSLKLRKGNEEIYLGK